MAWTIRLPEWVDLDRRLAGLQEFPVVLQLRSVDFRPRFDQTLLRLGEASAKAFDDVHREDSRVVLIVRVEMSTMVLRASFDEHPNHDPEEPREFRHARTLASSG
jgi:hypothetical protein